jgi:hypothetical protein
MCYYQSPYSQHNQPNSTSNPCKTETTISGCQCRPTTSYNVYNMYRVTKKIT